MRNRKLILIVAVVTVLSLCMQTGLVFGSSLSEIRDKIEKKESELDKGQKEEKSLASQVTEFEQELAELQSAIAEAEVKLKKLEKELAKAEKKLENQNKNLDARLRNMYKSGSIGFLDVLLDSGSFSEFLTNLDMVKLIYTSDQDFLEELQKAYDEVEKKKNEVETLQADLKESKAVTEEKKSTVEAKKAEIAASNEETEAMLDELEEEAEALTAELKRRAAEQAAQNNNSGGNDSGNSGNNSDSSGSSDSSGGRLSWPCSGTITSEQGYRIHPIYGYWKYHSGMDIAVPTGTPIRAAAGGTVIMAYYNGSYGNCVMIDHGGGLVTLYGHNSGFAVSTGQSVSRGQTVAYAGSTGASTGPHCHFEVRVNGDVKNPRDYL